MVLNPRPAKKISYREIFYPAAFWAASTALVLAQVWASHVYPNLDLMGWEILLIVFLSSSCGYLASLATFLVTFIFKTIIAADFAYMMFVYMMAAFIAYFIAIRMWYHSVAKTALAFAIFDVAFGSVWTMFLGVVHGKGMLYCTLPMVLEQTARLAPMSLLMVIVPYLFLNFAPDALKSYFAVARLYTPEQEDLRRKLARKPHSKLSSKITWMIVGVSTVLCLSAVIFGNLLLVRVDGTVAEAVDYFTYGKVHNFHVMNYMLAYDTKLVLLMLNVVVPSAVFCNYLAQRYIARPISEMAGYMRYFGKSTEGNRQMCMDCLSMIEIETHDEIEELHNSLYHTVGQINNYISHLQREKQLEADLAVARAESKAKSGFLSNMSHEIRTPINAVLGLDEMIIRESADQTITNYAMDIKNAGRQLLSIINDILDFSKIEAGKMEIIPVEYELSSAINDLVNMTSVKAKDKHLNFFVNTDKDVPHKLYGDEIRLKQVILNILTNAVKYTEKGSVLLTINFRKVDDASVALLVSVQDTGIGIRQEDIDKLYKPFQRVDEERNRTIEGTGLGMTIVQQLLGLMGSQIAVQSEYGKGSTFSFEVVQKVVSWDPMGDFTQMYKKSLASAEKYHESFHAPDARVLVVDDTKLNLTVIRGLLKQTQIQVDTATSGAEALQLVRQRRYSLLFIDHRMPGMDGIETLHVMQQLDGNLNKDVPCIALTANAISGARDMYLREGFHDYLSKPVDSLKLEKMILDYLPPKLVIRNAPGGGLDGGAARGAGVPAGPAAQPVGAERFAGVEGVDVAAALRHCGDADVLAEAMQDFVAAIDEKAADIERYAAERDYKNYTVLVHALKSSARLIGAAELSEKARFLEQCGDAQDEAQIEALTPPLLEEYRGYRQKLAAIMPPENDAGADGRPLIPDSDLKDALATLTELVEAFDFDSADMVLDQLDAYRMPDGYQATYANVRRLIKAVDRDAVLDALRA